MADLVFPVAYHSTRPTVRSDLLATAGGQGAFSYLDTKVYGPRQQRQSYNEIVWDIDPSTGAAIARGTVGTGKLIVPGTGGSAKAPGKRYFGSRAIGYNPNGLVLIRLIKI